MTAELERVCVLANKQVREWERQALERMVEETSVDVPLVVVYDPVDDNISKSQRWNTQSEVVEQEGSFLEDIRLFFEILPHERGWALVLAERKLAQMLGLSIEQTSLSPTHIEDVPCLEDAEFVYSTALPTRGGEIPRPGVSGVWKKLPDDIVDQIGESCDVVVRFGFGLIEGRILEEPEFGVLSFHASDIREYRGLAATERFLDGADTGGATLQQLTRDVDGGGIVALQSVDLSDAHSFEEQTERVNWLQTEMLAEGIENLRDPEFTPEPPSDPPPVVLLKRKQDWTYALRILARQLRARVRIAGDKLRRRIRGTVVSEGA